MNLEVQVQKLQGQFLGPEEGELKSEQVPVVQEMDSRQDDDGGHLDIQRIQHAAAAQMV